MGKCIWIFIYHYQSKRSTCCATLEFLAKKNLKLFQKEDSEPKGKVCFIALHFNMFHGNRCRHCAVPSFRQELKFNHIIVKVVTLALITLLNAGQCCKLDEGFEFRNHIYVCLYALKYIYRYILTSCEHSYQELIQRVIIVCIKPHSSNGRQSRGMYFQKAKALLHHWCLRKCSRLK